MMIGGTCHTGVRTRGGLAGSRGRFQVGVRCDVGGLGTMSSARSASAVTILPKALEPATLRGLLRGRPAGNGGGGTDGDAGSGGRAGPVTAGECCPSRPTSGSRRGGRAGPVVAGGVVVGAVLAISDRGNVAVLAGAGDGGTGSVLMGGDGGVDSEPVWRPPVPVTDLSRSCRRRRRWGRDRSWRCRRWSRRGRRWPRRPGLVGVGGAGSDGDAARRDVAGGVGLGGVSKARRGRTDMSSGSGSAFARLARTGASAVGDSADSGTAGHARAALLVLERRGGVRSVSTSGPAQNHWTGERRGNATREELGPPSPHRARRGRSMSLSLSSLARGDGDQSQLLLVSYGGRVGAVSSRLPCNSVACWRQVDGVARRPTDGGEATPDGGAKVKILHDGRGCQATRGAGRASLIRVGAARITYEQCPRSQAPEESGRRPRRERSPPPGLERRSSPQG